MNIAINPKEALTFPGMSQAVRSGDFVFLAGQVAMNENAEIVGENDPRRQAEQCFRNIEVLAKLAGGSLADVVRLTCYLSDESAYSAYSAIKTELFPERAPASTAVIVKALLDPRLLLEVEATLVLAQDTPKLKESA
jgi:2-iminobutanoate/2-iminopropanoate deaminase